MLFLKRCLALLTRLFEPVRRRLPTRISRVTIVLAWATLISNIGIIVTGGAVRLTASGLGCPEWPRCTAESWVATPEMGVHGVIEFGNRLLTYVLIAIAVAMFLSVLRLWATHKPLVVMTIIIGCGIPMQGVIGGITVWTNLNPWVVALHFLVSTVLVMVATMLLIRIRHEVKHQGQVGQPVADGAKDGFTQGMAGAILVASWVAVVLGTVVTGTGPHAGDPGSPRHDFDPEFVTRLHVLPVYILCAAIVALFIRQRQLQSSAAQKSVVWFMVAVVILQAVIGYWQNWTGLPILLVGAHMFGAAVTMAAATSVFERYRSNYFSRGLGQGSTVSSKTEMEPA